MKFEDFQELFQSHSLTFKDELATPNRPALQSKHRHRYRQQTDNSQIALYRESSLHTYNTQSSRRWQHTLWSIKFRFRDWSNDTWSDVSNNCYSDKRCWKTSSQYLRTQPSESITYNSENTLINIITTKRRTQSPVFQNYVFYVFFHISKGALSVCF